ncbi:hypothetical protein HDU86_005466, partial [Geranomyces michiganensis]
MKMSLGTSLETHKTPKIWDRSLDLRKVTFKNAQEAWRRVDAVAAGYEIERQTDWQHCDIMVKGPLNRSWANKPQKFHYRPALQIITELFGRQDLDIQLKAKQEYNKSQHRLYNEPWTGIRWERMQQKILEGGILLPIMISADATLLTNASGNQKLHPLYISLASIPSSQRNKDKNEAIVMSALMPEMSYGSKTESQQDNLRNAKWQLFHDCLSLFFAPVIKAAATGIVMTGPKNRQYHVFPVLWSISADYPEMVSFTTLVQGWCTSCTLFKLDLDKLPAEIRANPPPARTATLMRDAWELKRKRPQDEVLEAVVVKNFAWNWPHCDIYEARMPDLLHELPNGVWGHHLKKWVLRLIAAGGPAPDPLKLFDQRYVKISSYPGMKHFTAGPSTLSRLSAQDQSDMMRIFVAAMYEFPMRNHVQAFKTATECIQSFVNYFYLIGVPSMSEDNAHFIERELDTFWEKKEVFRPYTSKQNMFNFPKMHAMTKYAACFRENGAPAQYTTEHFERQHKKDIKTPYKESNKVAPTEQILKSVSRQLALAEKEREGHTSGTADKETAARPRIRGMGMRQQPYHLPSVARSLKFGRLELALRKWLLDMTNDPRRFKQHPPALSALPRVDGDQIHIYTGLKLVYGDIGGADKKSETLCADPGPAVFPQE